MSGWRPSTTSVPSSFIQPMSPVRKNPSLRNEAFVSSWLFRYSRRHWGTKPSCLPGCSDTPAPCRRSWRRLHLSCPGQLLGLCRRRSSPCCRAGALPRCNLRSWMRWWLAHRWPLSARWMYRTRRPPHWAAEPARPCLSLWAVRPPSATSSSRLSGCPSAQGSWVACKAWGRHCNSLPPWWRPKRAPPGCPGGRASSRRGREPFQASDKWRRSHRPNPAGRGWRPYRSRRDFLWR